MQDSTNFLVAPTSTRMGRPRINAPDGEKMTSRFREGTMDRIKAVLHEREPMSEFVRAAVEAELARRERPPE